jgi:hypothetical protein
MYSLNVPACLILNDIKVTTNQGIRDLDLLEKLLLLESLEDRQLIFISYDDSHCEVINGVKHYGDCDVSELLSLFLDELSRLYEDRSGNRLNFSATTGLEDHIQCPEGLTLN